jgi:hypothetical protein
MAVNAANPEACVAELTQGDLCALINFITDVHGIHNTELLTTLRIQYEVLDRIADSLKRIADAMAARSNCGEDLTKMAGRGNKRRIYCLPGAPKMLKAKLLPSAVVGQFT